MFVCGVLFEFGLGCGCCFAWVCLVVWCFIGLLVVVALFCVWGFVLCV